MGKQIKYPRQKSWKSFFNGVAIFFSFILLLVMSYVVLAL